EDVGDTDAMMPNQSPEPTAVGAGRSAIAVHVTSRRWLSFCPLGGSRHDYTRQHLEHLVTKEANRYFACFDVFDFERWRSYLFSFSP
ncbi:MAG TPA: hypothetical protein VL863_00115, partial [bacterium]|nr:hypothetical protein [bacterium]